MIGWQLVALQVAYVALAAGALAALRPGRRPAPGRVRAAFSVAALCLLASLWALPGVPTVLGAPARFAARWPALRALAHATDACVARPGVACSCPAAAARGAVSCGVTRAAAVLVIRRPTPAEPCVGAAFVRGPRGAYPLPAPDAKVDGGDVGLAVPLPGGWYYVDLYHCSDA